MDLVYRIFGIKAYNIYLKQKIAHSFNEMNISKKNDYIYERILDLLKFSNKNSDYYKKLFSDHEFNYKKFKSLEDLKKIPILEKNQLNLNIDKIHIPNKYSHLNFSGGSTSQPVRFYQDRNYWEWGELSRRWSYSISGISDSKKLFFYGSNFDSSSPESIKGRLLLYYKNQGYINAFSTNIDDLTDKIKAASLKKYKHLFGYASSLNYFTNICTQNEIDFKFDTIQCTGENLLPQYRTNIEKRFGKIVFDRYGTREVSIIASTSKNNYDYFTECSFHNYIETIKNKENNYEIVVTNLNNFCFPFIRYKIGDLVSKKKTHDDNYIFKNIKGRDLGILKTPKGNIVNLLIFPHLFGQIDAINDYQIIFFKDDLITINIVKNKNFSDQTINQIINIINDKLDSTYKVKINYMNYIDYDKNGKKQIVKFIDS